MPNSDIAGSEPCGQNPAGSPGPNLIELMSHIQTALAAIERKLVHHFQTPYADPADNRIVLDDIAPPFADLPLALDTCRAGFDLAMRIIKENSVTGMSSPARLTT